jgi:hypothetical protein
MIIEAKPIIENPTEPSSQTDSQSSSIQTAIAEINITPAITETSDFQAVLQQIPLRVQAANALLEGYRENPEAFLADIDDSVLDDQLKEMAQVSGFVKDIEKSRKDIKSYMNGVRDQLLDTLDKRLEGASFNELARAEADIKQLIKDMEADRRAKRWEEIKITFVANVDRYPLLGDFAQELADFSRFKLLFPKLVSGAKTRKVKETDHTMVNETLYAWNTAIEIMKGNEWGLAPQDLNQLLTMFKQNPSVELVQREGRQLKMNAEAREAARLEAEQRRIEAERQAKLREEERQRELARIQEQEQQAKLKQDIEAQKQAEQQRKELEERSRLMAEQERQRQAEYASFGGQYKTIFKESFPLFIEYLFKNSAYHDVHANAQTKASIIYDIMRQVERPDSVVTRETAKDPQKVLNLVRYILDA